VSKQTPPPSPEFCKNGTFLRLNSTCLTIVDIFVGTAVYTLGLRESVDSNLKERLGKLGADLIHSNRGGLTTFHGPGQLVAYPIFHLKHFKLQLREYVSRLENVAVHTCRMFGVNAKTDNSNVSHTGAWANNNKICAIGMSATKVLDH